jgi:putative SOS response-associated peptidase YedK
VCGRFTLRTPAKVLAELFDVANVPDREPHYNIAPTQAVAVVRLQAGGEGRELARMRWGLIPAWAGDPAIGNRLINARSETVATKPAFRQAFRSRRCLIPADGFYEWERLSGRKQPYYIRLKGDRPFGFAGLWEKWERAEVPIESCTILTTQANELVGSIHDRMPVIISPDDYALWLDPRCQDSRKLEALLRPFPAAEMTACPVSMLVNNPRNDLERCTEALR